MAEGPYSHWHNKATPRSRFMDSIGDGTGSIDMAVDASVTPQFFHLRAPEGRSVFMTELLITYAGGVGPYGPDEFGGQPCLLNGIEIGQYDWPSSTFFSGGEQLPIRCNKDWSSYSDNVYTGIWADKKYPVSVHIRLDASGIPVTLTSEDRGFACRISDDLSSLDYLHMYIRLAVGRLF